MQRDFEIETRVEEKEQNKTEAEKVEAEKVEAEKVKGEKAEAEKVKDEKEEAEKTEVEKLPGFWQDDRGVGVIEIVLILVILIGLVLVFKEQITAIVNNAFTGISGDANQILK